MIQADKSHAPTLRRLLGPESVAWAEAHDWYWRDSDSNRTSGFASQSAAKRTGWAYINFPSTNI
jgi:hypothetical protein